MSEPLVSIPLSLAKDLYDDCMFHAETQPKFALRHWFRKKADCLAEAIDSTQRKIDDGRYKDTVNPLVRPSNE